MAATLPIITVPPLTEYASKYGALPGSHKSGYTPLTSSFPAVPSDLNLLEIQQTEDFQRKKLYGFTTRELCQLDAISDRALKPATLQNQIIPLLQKDRWEVTPPVPSFTRTDLYPLKNGKGMWVMGNPEVERIFTPILRLASRILLSSHMLPWFDALMDGERRPIPDERIPEKYKGVENIQSFHARANYDPVATAARRDEKFQSLITKWNYTFGFASETEDPRGPHFDENNGNAFGVTIMNLEEMEFEKDRDPPPKWGMWTFIMLADAEPLFRDDLNDGERMGIEWAIATTIVHEITHAVGNISPIDAAEPNLDEPYFETEALAELGFGMEAAVNSGRNQSFIDRDDGIPMGFWLNTIWPTFDDRKAVQEDSPKLFNPGPSNFQRKFPVPIPLFSDVQQEEFWTVGVENFGQGLFHFRSMQEGIQIDMDVTPKRGFPGNGYSWVHAPPRRIRGNENYSSRFSDIGNRLAEIQRVATIMEVANLSVDDISVLEFGKRILISSQSEQQFWNNSVEQRTRVDNIFTCMQQLAAPTPTNQPQDNQKIHIFQSMLNLVRQIRENHEIMVSSIPSLEEVSGSFFGARRKDLLAWNRGTRIFLSRLQTISRNIPDPQVSKSLEEDALALEICRMRLWSPDGKLLDTIDAQELIEVQRARSSLAPADCRTICSNILVQTGCSITARCCTQIMLAAFNAGVAQGWEIQCAALQRIVDQLAHLRWASSYAWKEFQVGDNGWEDLGSKLIAHLRQTHGPQETQGPQ